MLGPLQVIAISCPPAGALPLRILDEVNRLGPGAAIRVLDVIVVIKHTGDGTVVPSPVGGEDDFGDMVSALLPGVADLPGVAEAAEDEVGLISATAHAAALKAVVGYPSTPMAFALIGDKLGISRGAAKSRAERAYRKLGVHDRTAAVTHARRMRVLR